MAFATIPEAIEEIRAGRMLVVVDDEDRENEGDLTMAASAITPEAINFMAKFGRGLICLALSPERCDQLHLPLVSPMNTSRFGTAFCESFDAVEGVTTGISAADRSQSIQIAIRPGARPQELARPGHMFPLRAREGGVLVRAGQTEASVDLARMAGLEPGGVICEIMKEDGTMARVPDLIPFCQRHGLLLVTVADLVAYRLRKDPIIRHLGAKQLVTSWGQVTVHRFEGLLDSSIHLAFTMGDLSGTPPLVRVHLETLPEDLLGFGPSGALHAAMTSISEEGRGVLVYLRRPAFPDPTPGPSDREVGIGAQILGHLGVHEMRLLSRNEKKYIGLRGFGLDIVAHVHLEAP